MCCRLKVQLLLCLNPPLGDRRLRQVRLWDFILSHAASFGPGTSKSDFEKRRKRTSSMPGKWLIDRKEFDHFYLQLIVSQ